MRDDSVYLELIADSIDYVTEYLKRNDGSLDEERFRQPGLAQDAVLRRLELLSDAAGHLSDELKARYPDIPWRQITNFRNVLAHGYLRLDFDRIWRHVTDDLPALDAVIRAELDGDRLRDLGR